MRTRADLKTRSRLFSAALGPRRLPRSSAQHEPGASSPLRTHQCILPECPNHRNGSPSTVPSPNTAPPAVARSTTAHLTRQSRSRPPGDRLAPSRKRVLLRPPPPFSKVHRPLPVLPEPELALGQPAVAAVAEVEETTRATTMMTTAGADADGTAPRHPPVVDADAPQTTGVATVEATAAAAMEVRVAAAVAPPQSVAAVGPKGTGLPMR